MYKETTGLVRGLETCLQYIEDLSRNLECKMTDIAEAIVTEEEFEAQIHMPVRCKVLIAMPHVEETFDGRLT